MHLLLSIRRIAILLVSMVHILKDINKQLHFTKCLSTNFLKAVVLLEKLKVYPLTNDGPIMIAVGGTIMTGQLDIEPERNSIHTIVALKRYSSDWYFTAFQNSRTQYIGRPEESQALTEELRQELLMTSKNMKTTDVYHFQFIEHADNGVIQGHFGTIAILQDSSQSS